MLSVNTTSGTTNVLALRVRAHLCQISGQGAPITYQTLAQAMDLSPPNTIQQITTALECLMEQDAAAARPLIATLVISKARGGLPGPGFFDCARRVGRFDGDPSGPEAFAYYTAEFDVAVKFWGATVEIIEQDI
ncbi:MAG: hypothetical protein COB08_010740 [Rhodobacteraceae bacterium]|nr:hypothetical protein [Paracoccaceae bacterium]